MLLGLRSPYSQRAVLPTVLADLILLALLAAFAYGAYRYRRQDVSIIYAIGLAFPFVYALSKATIVTDEPRYLLMLSPVVALLLGHAVSTQRRIRAAAVVTVGAALALSGVTLDRMDAWRKTHPREPAVAPRNITPLLHILERAGIDRVYAQYWVAYRIDFETNEHIVAAESKLTSQRLVDGRPVPAANPVIRWRPYQREVNASKRAGFVFIDWQQDKNRAQRLAFMHQLARYGFTRFRYANLVAYLPSHRQRSS
jgi:hypothetical protein